MESFTEFLKQTPKLKHLPLPGIASQHKMAVAGRQQDLAHGKAGFKKAAVMFLVYPINGQTHFVLIERAITDSTHSGQIALPGGRMDPEDLDNPMTTAIRETWEEVGVHPQQQEVLKAGTALYIPPSNYKVYPYFAFAKARPTFTLQESEVQSILEVPLVRLLDDATIGTKVLSTSYISNLEVPCFTLNDHVIWGATAMILMEFRDLLINTFK